MTKKQRHQIYKKANKENMLNIALFGDVYSICSAVARAKGEFHKNQLMGLSELLLFNPKSREYGGYWLPKEDLLTRQIILDFCIEMTKD